VLVFCVFFLGGLFGKSDADVSATAIADDVAGNPGVSIDTCVWVTSTKDLSNVVLSFCDGTTQKFDDLSGHRRKLSGTGENRWKEICCVWIKSGCNSRGDGPGYGEKILNPGTGAKVHGQNQAERCIPHVTATFGPS
jgi:hypothetical protein